MNKNFDKNIENTSLKTSENLNHQNGLFTHLSLNILPTLVSWTPLIWLISTSIPASIPLIPVKYKCRKPQKYLILGNFFRSSNIYYVIDNLYYDVINMKLPPYTLSREKEILELSEKWVFKDVNPKNMINSKNMPVDKQVFNIQFDDEIKNTDSNQAFEKSYLVVQAYYDFNKDLVLTQSSTNQWVS